MFFSIILTIKDFIFKKNFSDSTEVLLQSILNSFRETNKHISSINISLSKGHERTISYLDSLLSEGKKANQKRDGILSFINQSNKNINSHFNIINQSFKEVLNVLSRGAKEEIIAALENVISEFNKNLTEQFGDNFKQLNESVKNMIVWQENYKVAIEQVERNLQVTLTNLEMNAEHSRKLTVNFEKISKTSQDLSSIIQTNENQIKNLETHMSSLKKIGDEAHLIVASINDFSKSIQGSLTNQSEGLNKLKDNLAQSLNNLNRALTSLTDKFRDDYEGYLKRFSQLLEQLIPRK